MEDKHIHLVSDATGETVNSVAKACLVQFDDLNIIEHAWPLIRSDVQMERVLEGIAARPGIVLGTLVNDELRKQLQEGCKKLDVPFVPVLDPVLATLTKVWGSEAGNLPGRQHAMDDEYFKRIDAMHFVMSHDDGQSAETLREADIIILGVSRTSKTPTCVYLANRGLKAANVPIVPGCPLPPELELSKEPLIVGLTKDPQRLVQIRKNRLRMLNQMEDTDYVDLETVIEEVKEARRLYTRRGWPIIDVSRKSIEETTAAIVQLYKTHRESAND